MPLGQPEQLGSELGRGRDGIRDVLHERHLVEEPGVDAGGLVHLLDRQTATQRLLDLHDATVGGAPGGVEDRDTYFRMEGIQRMVKLFTNRQMNDDTMRELLTLLVHDPAIVTDALVAERMKVCVEQPTEVLSTMSVPNLTDALGDLRAPVLGFWGTDDRFNPVGGALKFLERCRDARFVLMNRCGHWVMVEHADYFNRECLDFLATRNTR